MMAVVVDEEITKREERIKNYRQAKAEFWAVLQTAVDDVRAEINKATDELVSKLNNDEKISLDLKALIKKLISYEMLKKNGVGEMLVKSQRTQDQLMIAARALTSFVISQDIRNENTRDFKEFHRIFVDFIKELFSAFAEAKASYTKAKIAIKAIREKAKRERDFELVYNVDACIRLIDCAFYKMGGSKTIGRLIDQEEKFLKVLYIGVL